MALLKMLRTMKSKLVILDANVIIDCHRNEVWKQIISSYEIYIPATIFYDEAKYFVSKNTDEKKDINLSQDKDHGKIKVIEAEISHIQNLKTFIKDDFFESIDPGEREAIALLKSGHYDDYVFCTGDKAAIRALTILDLSFQGISLEKLLKDASIKFEKFKPNYSESEFKKQQGKGLQEKNFLLKP